MALFGGPAVDRGAVDVSDDDFSSVTEMDDFSEAKHSARQVGNFCSQTVATWCYCHIHM